MSAPSDTGIASCNNEVSVEGTDTTNSPGCKSFQSGEAHGLYRTYEGLPVKRT